MRLSGEILVTGGAGFIGSHIVDKLLDMEDVTEVRVLDDFSTGKIENLTGHLENPKLKVVKGDVRKRGVVKKVMKGVDCVFHEAAITSVPVSIKKPLMMNRVNVDGTLNVLEEARVNDSTLIYASSFAVYGEPRDFPIKETTPPRPISPYGASKLSAEAYCLSYHEAYGLRTTCLRLSNVYGPRQFYSPYAGVITVFVNRALKGEPLIIYGDGEQTRDFIYVEDVVNVNLLTVASGKAYGEVFNVGTEKETSVNVLASKIKSIVGRESLRVIYKPAIKGDIRRSVADISRMKALLGYKPKMDLDNGLLQVIKWFSER